MLPPDEYYEELAKLCRQWSPKADPDLLEQMIHLLISFDMAAAFAILCSNYRSSWGRSTMLGPIVGQNVPALLIL